MVTRTQQINEDSKIPENRHDNYGIIDNDVKENVRKCVCKVFGDTQFSEWWHKGLWGHLDFRK